MVFLFSNAKVAKHDSIWTLLFQKAVHEKYFTFRITCCCWNMRNVAKDAHCYGSIRKYKSTTILLSGSTCQSPSPTPPPLPRPPLAASFWNQSLDMAPSIKFLNIQQEWDDSRKLKFSVVFNNTHSFSSQTSIRSSAHLNKELLKMLLFLDENIIKLVNLSQTVNFSAIINPRPPDTSHP